MKTIGHMIAASAKLGLNYADRLLNGISPETFSSFARCAETSIESNHPAFIFGHLSLYAPRIVTELGGDDSEIQPSEEAIALFSKDAKCLDDPSCTIYPAMSEIVSQFRVGYEAAIHHLESADDSQFTNQNPNEAMRKLFPTLGSMHAFYVGGHFMLHMGQLSAWRRANGLGAA